MKRVLPEFQSFLIERGIIPKKHVPYYAFWVSRFFAFFKDEEGLDFDVEIEKFLNYLNKQEKVAQWQVQQARESLKLYIEDFSKGRALKEHFNSFARGNVKDITQVLDKMSKAIRIKHYSYKTERSYLDWAKRFYNYMVSVKNKEIALSKLGSQDVRNYLNYLAIKKRVSSSTQNQAFSALLFLFKNVLHIKVEDLDKTVRAKRGTKIPLVLSIEEVQKIFSNIDGVPWLILRILYGSGLRLMELARLRVQDIDFTSSLVFVRSAKGDKDRITMLPESVKDDLFSHLERVRQLHAKDLKAGYGEVYLPNALERKYRNAAKEWCWQYVFPSSKLSVDPRTGKVRRHHISDKAIQNAVKIAVKKAGIAKPVTVHTFRHNFATHLLMDGINIREIQQLLGHKNVETTMVYTHVLRDMSNAPKSPLDSLYKK